MMAVMRTYAVGKPVPKGSLRRNSYGATFNQGGHRLADWMRAVGMTGLAARAKRQDVPSLGPVRLWLKFYMPRPARPKEPAYPVAGDIDKLTRAVLDALTGVWYADDSQVVSITATKAWAESQEPGVEVCMEWG